MDPDEKKIERMNWVFYASFGVHFLGLVLAFVGLVARASGRHWGIWFTITGWSTFFAGFLLRSWVKRWFRKLRGE